MRSFLKCLLCCFVLVGLCACRERETMDLSGFLAHWNKNSHQTLSYEDFFLEETGTETRCFTLLEPHLLLRLFFDDADRLREVRLILTKAAPDGSARTVEAGERDAFLAAAQSALCAYCMLPSGDAETLLRSLLPAGTVPLSEPGEWTTDADPFHFVLLSTQLETVLCIQSKWLNTLESTHKPESKPPFDATTATRSDTVPHK